MYFKHVHAYIIIHIISYINNQPYIDGHKIDQEEAETLLLGMC